MVMKTTDTSCILPAVIYALNEIKSTIVSFLSRKLSDFETFSGECRDLEKTCESLLLKLEELKLEELILADGDHAGDDGGHSGNGRGGRRTTFPIVCES